MNLAEDPEIGSIGVDLMVVSSAYRREAVDADAEAAVDLSRRAVLLDLIVGLLSDSSPRRVVQTIGCRCPVCEAGAVRVTVAQALGDPQVPHADCTRPPCRCRYADPI